MRFWIKPLSISFLLLFMWQLGILFSGPFIQSQHSVQSEVSFGQFVDCIDNSTVAESDDLPSNIITEEVIEEEIDRPETLSVTSVPQFTRHYAFYCVSDYYRFIPLDSKPPEVIG